MSRDAARSARPRRSGPVFKNFSDIGSQDLVTDKFLGTLFWELRRNLHGFRRFRPRLAAANSL
jgi:hypothetical protein